MTKILNKKERVIDFKLTPYGRYKLSIGTFKPVYYAFYDTGIVYDSTCAGIEDELQNDIHPRIKDDTQFLATQTHYDFIIDDPGMSTSETEVLVDPSTGEPGLSTYFPIDIQPSLEIPTADFFRFDSSIGDAHFNGKTQQSAPALKIVTLNGDISGSSYMDTINNQDIPQVDIVLNYIKKVDEKRFVPDPESAYEIIGATPTFADNRVIRVVENNLLLYAEEMNTDLLTENFEIEVFMSGSDNTLKKKFFEKQQEQIVNGYMVSKTQKENSIVSLYTGSVEYYFDIFTDSNVNQSAACRGANIFSKDSYYIDLDFDCYEDESENIYYDIYGSAVGEGDVEICQD